MARYRKGGIVVGRHSLAVDVMCAQGTQAKFVVAREVRKEKRGRRKRERKEKERRDLKGSSTTR